MTAFDTLIIVIISVTVVSVILAIIDWIHLASLASKTTLLEQEVEKKAIEFDALKKERSSNIGHGGATIIESPEAIPGGPTPCLDDTSGTSTSDTIQIMRNVRGIFQKQAEIIPCKEGSIEYQINPVAEQQPLQQTPSFTVPDSSTPHPPPNPIHHQHAMNIPNAPDTASLYLTDDYKRQFATVAQNPESSRYDPAVSQPTRKPSPGTGAVRIALFSENTKDADFQALWSGITSILETQPQPAVVIDMRNINFMYDKEMDYLEKINYLLSAQGGKLSLMNCDGELLALLGNRPALRSIIQ